MIFNYTVLEVSWLISVMIHWRKTCDFCPWNLAFS